MPEYWPPRDERETERKRLDAWRPWLRLMFWTVVALVLWSLFETARNLWM
ncbi:MAG: hypothetical protein R3C30_09480 [Hyphomonadaceae bacterium]